MSEAEVKNYLKSYLKERGISITASALEKIIELISKNKKLSTIERNSIDSLNSLMVRGDHENNVEIMKQIKGIVKGN